jgi:TatD DNase family protein
MTSGLVDFHCHLDLFPDPVAAIDAAEKAGIYTLTVTTTPRAWPRNLQADSQKTLVRAALGLHPQVVVERAAEFSPWEQYLPQARYIASPRSYRSPGRSETAPEFR